MLGGNFARKHVPINLRQLLSAESAANDGLAYPFLTIAIYLTVDVTTREAIGHWFLVGWLCVSFYFSSLYVRGLNVIFSLKTRFSWGYSSVLYSVSFFLSLVYSNQ